MIGEYDFMKSNFFRMGNDNKKKSFLIKNEWIKMLNVIRNGSPASNLFKTLPEDLETEV